MPICANVVPLEHNGQTYPALVLDHAQTNFSTCVYVVESGDEFQNNLWNMSPEDGAIFSAGVVSCWLVAFGIRSILSILRGSTHES